MNRYSVITLSGLFLLLLLIVPSQILRPVKGVYLRTAEPLLAVTSRFFNNILHVGQWARVYEENRAIQKSLEHYRGLTFKTDELELENDRLRSYLGLKKKLSKTYQQVVVAEVIGRPPSGWHQRLLINMGKEDGLVEGIPVLAPAGLLGEVDEVYSSTAIVKLITHSHFKVGALIQRTRHSGLVYGTADGESRMKYIAMDADVQVGDVVQTASFSKKYPKGIFIGWVESIWKETGQLYRVASIRLAADIDRAEEVFCVVP
jgi:rod shape-determining protein MreC